MPNPFYPWIGASPLLDTRAATLAPLVGLHREQKDGGLQHHHPRLARACGSADEERLVLRIDDSIELVGLEGLEGLLQGAKVSQQAPLDSPACLSFAAAD